MNSSKLFRSTSGSTSRSQENTRLCISFACADRWWKLLTTRSSLCTLRQSSELLSLTRVLPGSANHEARYFFSHQVANSLDVSEYTLSLAKTCITYLCQEHHDPDTDESQFETHFLNGVYRLHHYATGSWIRLLQLYFQAKEMSPACSQLLDLLHRVLDHRVNADHDLDDGNADFSSFKSLKNAFPELYRLLCREAYFHQRSESNLVKLGMGKTSFSFRRQPLQKPISIRVTKNILIRSAQTTGTNRTP